MSTDVGIDWPKVVTWIVGLFTTVLAWAGKRQVARIDKHEQRMDEFEANYLRKEDLQQMENRITSTIQTSANHTAERIGDVKATADKAHERIDRMGERK